LAGWLQFSVGLVQRLVCGAGCFVREAARLERHDIYPSARVAAVSPCFANEVTRVERWTWTSLSEYLVNRLGTIHLRSIRIIGVNVIESVVSRLSKWNSMELLDTNGTLRVPMLNIFLLRLAIGEP
jgi:hypothetical protein